MSWAELRRVWYAAACVGADAPQVYEVLEPTNLGVRKRIEGVVVVDSFTSLSRPWRQSLGAVLNDIYAETGRVVAGIRVSMLLHGYK